MFSFPCVALVVFLSGEIFLSMLDTVGGGNSYASKLHNCNGVDWNRGSLKTGETPGPREPHPQSKKAGGQEGY